MGNFGKELILDMHDCDVSKFNRKDIEDYFIQLCNLIDMVRMDLYFWDYLDAAEEDKPKLPEEAHLVGTSAIQFIRTSNVTIHTIDLFESVYLNIFSCKEFDEDVAKKFSEDFFRGNTVNFHVMDRV